jgi:hypothetical protein
MVKDTEILRKYQNSFISGRGRLSYSQSRELFSGMWEEAVTLGVFPPVDPMAGIDVDIRIARILNTCLTKPSPS